MRRIRYAFEFSLTAFFAALIERLPLRWVFGLAVFAGDVFFFFFCARRRTAVSNLSRAYGTAVPEKRKQEIARESMRAAAMSAAELYMVRRIKKEVPNRFKVFGAEYFEEAFGRGRGVVSVISHLGSWEYLSFVPFLTGRPWSVVVRDIRNPFLDRMINDLRRETGVNPIPKEDAAREVLRRLRANEGVGILIDQWAGPEGLWVPFFGEETSTTSIPARLQKRTGCSVVPSYCVRTAPGCYEIQVKPGIILDPEDRDFEARLTKVLNASLEEQILKYPGQWMWIHRRWKPKPAAIRNSGGSSCPRP